MKIFNWVHRKLHQKDNKITEPIIENEIEKQILLKHMAHPDLLENWKDGILSIGTFGFDPISIADINTEIKKYEKHDEEKEIKLAQKDPGLEEYDEEEQIIIPLVFVKCELNENISSNEKKVEMELSKFIKDDNSSEDGDDGKIKNMKERITLADLFTAEYDEEAKTKTDNCILMKEFKNKANDINDQDGKKKKKSFSKNFMKLGFGGDADLRPMKKVERMVRKMVKKKIHPSMEEKVPMKSGEIIMTV